MIWHVPDTWQRPGGVRGTLNAGKAMFDMRLAVSTTKEDRAASAKSLAGNIHGARPAEMMIVGNGGATSRIMTVIVLALPQLHHGIEKAKGKDNSGVQTLGPQDQPGTPGVGRRGLTCLALLLGGNLVGRRGLTWGSLKEEDLGSRNKRRPVLALQQVENGQTGRQQSTSCHQSHHRHRTGMRRLWRILECKSSCPWMSRCPRGHRRKMNGAWRSS